MQIIIVSKKDGRAKRTDSFSGDPETVRRSIDAYKKRAQGFDAYEEISDQEPNFHDRVEAVNVDEPSHPKQGDWDRMKGTATAQEKFLAGMLGLKS